MSLSNKQKTSLALVDKRGFFSGGPEGILFFGYRKPHRGFLPNSLLALLAEFGGRFESLQTYNKKHTADAVCFLLVDLKGFEPTTSRMRTERSPN